MNRKLKFRVWNKVNKTLHHKVEINIIQIFNGEPDIIVRGTGDLENRDCPDTFILQQFTGLKDKNGKEIYEGDILNVKNSFNSFESVYQIKFRGMGFWFVDIDDDSSFVFDSNAYEIKVMGNIFENHELLNEKH